MATPLRPTVLRALLAKEFREVLRDRRTLLLTLVLPAVVYPVLMAALGEVSAVAMASLKGRPVTVAVQGTLDADVKTALGRAQRMTVKGSADAAADVNSGDADVGLRHGEPAEPGADPALELLLDNARDESRAAADKVEVLMRAVREARLEERVQKLGVRRAYLEPLPVERTNTSSRERMGAYIVAQMLPFLLIVLSLVGATATAVDTTAGERERGTLLTLMSTPVTAAEVAASKLITVAAVAMASGGANLVALLLSLRATLGKMAQFNVDITPRMIVGTVGALLPTTIYCAALLLGLAALGKTTKEAQASTAPALFIALGLSAITVVPGIRATPLINALPVSGPALLMRDLIMGSATFTQAATVTAASAVTLWLMLSFSARVLQSEPLLGAHLGAAAVLRDVAGHSTPTALAASLVGSSILAVAVYLAPPLQRAALVPGLVATQVLMALAPLLVLKLLGLPVAELTGIRMRPPGRAMAAALLWGTSLGVPLMMWQAWMLEVSGMKDAMEDLGRAAQALMDLQLSPVEAVLLLGVLPGVFEELAFRGALLGTLLKVTTPARAITVQAILFALAHQSLLRLPPTFILGILMGILRTRSRSVWPGMLMHGLHNGLVAGAAFGGTGLVDLEPLVESFTSGPMLAALFASILVAGGLAWRTRADR